MGGEEWARRAEVSRGEVGRSEKTREERYQFGWKVTQRTPEEVEKAVTVTGDGESSVGV